jgi:hypothetical protein
VYTEYAKCLEFLGNQYNAGITKGTSLGCDKLPLMQFVPSDAAKTFFKGANDSIFL